jgi:hypothetical protein
MESILRDDEEFIRRSVESYLREVDSVVQIEANKPDPPDCYAISKGMRIPMEITRAEMGFMHGGTRQSNLGFINSLITLVEELSAKLDAQCYDYFLEIYIEGPVLDYKTFKRYLEDEIRAFAVDSSKYSYDKFYFFYVGAGQDRVGIQKTHRRVKGQFLQANIAQKGDVDSYLIQGQTDAIYAHIVRQKNRIMAAMDGAKWLAIYNGYPLAEEHNIRAALAKLAKSHSFTRIFVVNGEGRVFEVGEQLSNSACS